MNPEQKQIDQLKAEIEYYKKMITWYRDTYETRSFFGVLKERLHRDFKNNLSSYSIKRFTGNPFYIKPGKKQDISVRHAPSVDKSSFYSMHTMDKKLYRIGIFVHLYYQDIWQEINTYLDNLGINFDLLITINEDDVNCDQTIAEIKKSYPKAIILKVPNKGLDIGPFFELVNYVISKGVTYDYVLKIHTKKSLGADPVVGETWRNKSYESLMGSQSIVYHILRLFETQPSIGMIGPYETRMSTSMNDFQKRTNANAANIVTLAKKLEIRDQQLDFFGGTMFWVKWPLLESKFKRRSLTIHDFEPGYKKDELLSHAMERLLASIIRDAGHTLFELNRVNDYLFYKSRKKKICWIHPGYGIGGGNRVIFELCQEQLKFYDVYSVSFMGQPFNNWINVNHTVLNFSSTSDAKYFIETMNIDYVFATGWQTVDLVKSLKDPIKKYYFIQDYEPWFGDADTEAAKATYSKSFNGCIVIAEWLKKQLSDSHKLDSLFVKLGTRAYPIDKINRGAEGSPCKILLYFKLKSHRGRGSDLILQLLKKLSNNKSVELHVFGHENPEVEGITFHGELHKEKLTELYSSMDIFIDLSRHRGIATIALEIAQFGVVPLLAAKNFGLKEYGFIDHQNCLFVDDVDDTCRKVLELAGNADKYQQLKNGILSLSKSFEWKYTSNDINQIIDILT